MTRWKKEDTTTVLTMHAHNRWSCWSGEVLCALDALGVPVGLRSYQQYDGSVTREYYVSTDWLSRVGGMERVREIAEAEFCRINGID